MELTQKEISLLKDLKESEELCIQKYSKNSEAAYDKQLKNLFANIATQEQKHLDTLIKIENGKTPTVPTASATALPKFKATYKATETEEKENDCFLCSDVLAAEKHTSHLYDTCVFEFANKKQRDLLNHIQKEEQTHGKMIYDYMKANAMYG